MAAHSPSVTRLGAASVAIVLLTALGACAASGGAGGGDSEPGPTGIDPGNAAFSTCSEIEALIVPQLEDQYDTAIVSAVEWSEVSPLPPGVTPPAADCAWLQVVPAGSSDGSGITADDMQTVYSFYLRDGADIVADLAEQVAAAGCFDAGADGFGEAFCNVENPDVPEGWTVYYAEYAFSVPVTATEVDISYAKASLN